MSTRQRSLSWSNALQGLRADRRQVPAGFLGARGRVEGFVRFEKVALVKADGSFDRAAIMTSAAKAAKAHQVRHGGSWQAAISVALRAAWQVARTTRAKAAH